MERRFSPSSLTVERADGDPVIVGYAAVFYNGSRSTEFKLFDGLVERIMPGAFTRAIEEGQDVRGLFNHNSSSILGRTKADTMTLREDDRGLRYEIQPSDSESSRSVVSAIERGDVSGSSFAFNIIEQLFRTEGDTDIREIRDVDLFDVGPVTFPAYEATEVGVRSVSPEMMDDVRNAWRRWKDDGRRQQQAIEARVRLTTL